MNHPPIWPGISWRNAGRRERQETEDRNKGKGGGRGWRVWETGERENERESKMERWTERGKGREREIKV